MDKALIDTDIWLEIMRGVNPTVQVEILPLDYAAGELAGELYARLELAGVPIRRLDPLIAATALRHQLVLATGNVRHYARVVELDYPLRIVNWLAEGSGRW